MNNHLIAEAMYNEYRGAVGGRSVTGAVLPCWNELLVDPQNLDLGIALTVAARYAIRMMDSKHQFWGAGEPDCPADIKAPNGELHTLQCKLCGARNPKSPVCLAGLE